MPRTLVLLLAVVWLCASGAGAAAPAPNPARVLFIGNSYTYTHNLPDVVRRVAAAAGITLTVRSLTAPGVAIEDHFSSGALPAALHDRWDLVVLQQGPSSLLASRRHLVYWTERVHEALPAGARIVMFSVWPARENLPTWLRAEHSYAKAAQRVDGCMFPAAGAWRLAMADGLRVPLYSADNLHPTREGTLLAALAMVHAVWGGAEPAPIGTLASQFPGSEWRSALAVSAELDRYARQAVQRNHAACTAAG